LQAYPTTTQDNGFFNAFDHIYFIENASHLTDLPQMLIENVSHQKRKRKANRKKQIAKVET